MSCITSHALLYIFIRIIMIEQWKQFRKIFDLKIKKKNEYYVLNYQMYPKCQSLSIMGIHVWVPVCMFVYNCLSNLIMKKCKQIKWLKGFIDLNIYKHNIICYKHNFFGILFSKFIKGQINEKKKINMTVNQASISLVIKWKIIAALHCIPCGFQS